MPLSLKKALGQHFLHDEHMCQKIVSQIQYQESMNLLEVGPGGGALTKYLLGKPGVAFKAIEIDQEKVNYLLAQYPQLSGSLIHQDILKADAPFEDAFSIIGNFPYNISSPILFQVLAWEPQVEQVVGMFQKEVAQRIAAPPGTKTYGILSVLVQAFFSVTYLFDVHEACFTPPPKVKSGVLHLKNSGNPHHIDNKKRFITLVKTAFNQRRKTLRNALKPVLQPGQDIGPVGDQRAERLSVSDFVTLYNNIS